MGRVRVFYGHEGVVPPTGSTPRPAAAPEPEVEEVIVSDLSGAPVEIVGEAISAEGLDSPAEVVLADGTPAPVGEDGIPVLEGEALPDDSWTKGDLIAFAEDRGIDMTGATKTKPAALERVLESIKEA